MQLKNNHIAVLLLIVLIGLVGYQTFAYRPAMSNSPAVIATVNLEQLFKGLDEKTAADEQLKQMATKLNDEAEAKMKEIKQIDEDLKDHPKGSPTYSQMQEQQILLAGKYQAYLEYCKRKIEAEKGRSLKRIYLNIKNHANQLASQNGYDIVLVDDSLAEIPLGTEEETSRQISARRMLFTSTRLDITADLLERMNAGTKATGNNPAANAGNSKTP
jgi:Skp family chaperone for outer membrane proteins